MWASRSNSLTCGRLAVAKSEWDRPCGLADSFRPVVRLIADECIEPPGPSSNLVPDVSNANGRHDLGDRLRCPLVVDRDREERRRQGPRVSLPRMNRETTSEASSTRPWRRT